MVRSLVVLAALGACAVQGEKVLPLFDQPIAGADAAFNSTFESFLSEFNAEHHNELMKLINDGVDSYLESSAFTGSGLSCGAASSGSVQLPTKFAAFPGGSTSRVFGMDISKLVDKLASASSGPAGAQGPMAGILALEGIQAGAGMVKAAMSPVLQIVPRMIPPNQPLTCMPMITGHNCFGAVLHPITAADFVLADTTDSQLDGVIAGFPTLYKRKVGTTSDAAYKTCFSAYMSMHCASLFPRCSVPQAGNEPGPTGRLPMCFTHCLATLVACPGMWVEDIMGECTSVSVPPMCSTAFFNNFHLLPPQYRSYESTLPSGQECPVVPSSLRGFEGASLANVYDDSAILGSAYGGASRVPVA